MIDFSVLSERPQYSFRLQSMSNNNMRNGLKAKYNMLIHVDIETVDL